MPCIYIHLIKKRKKKEKKSLPTYPIFFMAVTENTTFFFFGLIEKARDQYKEGQSFNTYLQKEKLEQGTG
jgi:hypothetical protein